jgi:hypothetical protein
MSVVEQSKNDGQALVAVEDRDLTLAFSGCEFDSGNEARYQHLRILEKSFRHALLESVKNLCADLVVTFFVC